MRKASTSKSWIAAFVIPVFLLLAGLGWWYVRRERRRTRAATKAFGDAMDEHDVRQRMLRLRLERVFGLDRIRDFHSPGEPEQADESKERERKRLRELLLPSYRRRREARDNIELSSKAREADLEQHARHSHWFAPPPPYAPSGLGTAASSTTTIATVGPPESKAIDLGKTKVISMGSPDASTSTFEGVTGGLRPPPRPSVKDRLDRDRELRRATGTGSFGEHSSTGGLEDLWPALGQKRDEADRRWEHGFI